MPSTSRAKNKNTKHSKLWRSDFTILSIKTTYCTSDESSAFSSQRLLRRDGQLLVGARPLHALDMPSRASHHQQPQRHWPVNCCDALTKICPERQPPETMWPHDSGDWLVERRPKPQFLQACRPGNSSIVMGSLNQFPKDSCCRETDHEAPAMG